MRRVLVSVSLAVLTLAASAPPAFASSLLASPSRITLLAPIATTTEATLTFTNTSSRTVELTGAFLTYKPFLAPGQQGQLNALSFFTVDCGLRVLAPGESCSYTVVFQPGVLDDPDPEPGTVFRGRIVQQTDRGPVPVMFTATAA
jgi:hypothetical protein